jgi:hypothetical protein
MNVEVVSETDAEGVQIARRYEDGQLVSTCRSQKLASGKQVMQFLDGAGNNVQEIHSYGMKIMLTVSFGPGGKSESYLVKKRLVAREKYEQARDQFPDMPPADPTLVDHNAELLKLVQLERKQQKLLLKNQSPDPKRAEQSDEFCTKMMARDQVADAYAWIDLGKNSLGEMNRSASKRLLAKLKSYGCPRVWACEIDRAESGSENSGNLIVELPSDALNRAQLFKWAAKAAQQRGFDPEPDDGQKFMYLKLD